MMIDSTLSEAAESMRGIMMGDDVRFSGVSTDTRSIESGQLFVALQGPNFDGSAYVSTAAERQAVAAVVGREVETSLPTVRVDDTRVALGQLAAAWRKKMPATVVGLTGSNGKTTVKEMIASCLRLEAQTVATEGNLNNEIGLPLTLLRIGKDDKFAVIEMGANHAGEIDYLSSLAVPAVVAITNAGSAHLEGFGSIEGVARAKGEILQVAPRPKVAVLNADDDYFDYWTSLASDLEIVSFGMSDNATVFASDVQADAGGSSFNLHMPKGSIDVNLPLRGEHNVRNACAAAAVCAALGLTTEQVRAGLESVTPVGGRLKALAGLHGSTLFDDSYNANPSSAIAAARFLASLDGESVLVLADMGELGDDSDSLHQAVGVAAREAGVQRLLATGELSRHTVAAFGEHASWYESVEEIIEELQNSLTGSTNVLVKGSRSMRMGRVVRAIQSATDEAGAA